MERRIESKLIYDILTTVPDAIEIWFHGSRFRGDHRQDSDTDIQVIVPDDVRGGDYLDIVIALERLGNQYINFDIQPGHLNDMVNRVVRKQGKLLWSRDQKSDISESQDISSLRQVLSDFLPLAVNELRLSKIPRLKLEKSLNYNGQPSFGGFNPARGTIELAIGGRHPVDICRTLAHELVHHKQAEENQLDHGSGTTGSPEENQANSMAGIIMRKFNKEFPKHTNGLSLQENKDYVQNDVAYNDELSPKAWQNEKLRIEVRYKLLEAAKFFIDYLEILDFRVLDIVLTGSMANYNYTEYSDFDVHVVTRYADLKCDDIAEAFYKARKEIWNSNHDIIIRGHDVELYVEDIENSPVSSGVYSLLDDKWVKKPTYDPPDINDTAVNLKVSDLIKQIDSTIKTADDPNDIHRILKKIVQMRRSGLDVEGEFSIENLAFKILRNQGYIKRLVDAFRKQQDIELSL